MKSRWRRMVRKALLWTMAMVVALPIVAWAVLYGDSVWQRRKAERLFAEVNALKPRMATFADAQAFAKLHPDRDLLPGIDRNCSPEHCTIYTSLYYDGLHGRIWEAIGRNRTQPGFLDHLGLRDWWVHVEIDVDHGTIESTKFKLAVLTVHDENLPDWFLNGVLVDRYHNNVESPWGPEYDPGPYVAQPVHVSALAGGQAIRVQIDNRATPEQFSRAADVQFACTTKIVPCYQLREFAPSVYDDLARDDAERGMKLSY